MAQSLAGKTESNPFKDLPVGRKPVALPRVKNVRSKGRLYHYFKTHDGYARLPDESWQAFGAAYQTHMRALTAPKTLRCLIRLYERSEAYARLKPASTQVYSHVLRRLWNSYGNMEIEGFCIGQLDRFSQSAGHKGTARTYIKVVSALFSWARQSGYADHDPADGLMNRLRQSQWVYFIGAGDGEPVKIGRSNSLERRLSTIQSGNHRKMHVLAAIKAEDGRDVERAYHARFAAHRLHGEWFLPHPDILAEIERLKP